MMVHLVEFKGKAVRAEAELHTAALTGGINVFRGSYATLFKLPRPCSSTVEVVQGARRSRYKTRQVVER